LVQDGIKMSALSFHRACIALSFMVGIERGFVSRSSWRYVGAETAEVCILSA